MSDAKPVASAALVRLYPRRWREKYGQEMEHVLAHQSVTLRLIVDLLAGAIDAHINPQGSSAATNAADARGGTAVTKLLTHCQPQDITGTDYSRSVVVLFATTIVLAMLHIQLKRTFGDHPVVDAFGASTFPVAVLASSWGTYFKRYSLAAKLSLVLGLGALVFLISLSAAIVGKVF
jgi:hypothetical protein